MIRYTYRRGGRGFFVEADTDMLRTDDKVLEREVGALIDVGVVIPYGLLGPELPASLASDRQAGWTLAYAFQNVGASEIDGPPLEGGLEPPMSGV